eukprot:SAG11_NODE_1849_length_4169_cov_2.639312_2_plen_374_part_00
MRHAPPHHQLADMRTHLDSALSVGALCAPIAHVAAADAGDDPAELTYLLLGKLGRRRCLVLDFVGIRISRRVQKLAAAVDGFAITVDRDLAAVIDGCIEQHQHYQRAGACGSAATAAGCWLSNPPLRRLLGAMQRKPAEAALAGLAARVVSIELRAQASGEIVVLTTLCSSVRFGGTLATLCTASLRADACVCQAGELGYVPMGYVVGRVYTSLTGFRRPGTSSCGTLQLVATAALLRRCGFAFWDLDSPLPYKQALGAAVVEQREFLRRLHVEREGARAFDLPSAASEAVSASGLVRELLQAQAERARAHRQAKGEARAVVTPLGGGDGERRGCGKCSASLPRSGFSKSQWERAGSSKKQKSGHCLSCVAEL